MKRTNLARTSSDKDFRQVHFLPHGEILRFVDRTGPACGEFGVECDVLFGAASSKRLFSQLENECLLREASALISSPPSIPAPLPL